MSARRSAPLPVSVLDTGPLLEAMRKLLMEIGHVNMKLAPKSPTRAGLKTLSDQMKEVGTIITGDPNHFNGKGHKANFGPGS